VRPEAQEIATIGKAAFDKAKRVLAASNGPNGCPVKLTDPAAAERLKKEEVWRSQRMKRVEQKAKELGLKVENAKAELLKYDITVMKKNNPHGRKKLKSSTNTNNPVTVNTTENTTANITQALVSLNHGSTHSLPHGKNPPKVT